MKQKNTKQTIEVLPLQGSEATSEDLSSEIKQLASEVGYTACGITSADSFEEYALALQERGSRFPEAAHLYARMRKRIDPRSSVPWARSIFVCVRRYGKYAIPKELIGYIGREYLVEWRHEECPDHDKPKKMETGLKRLGLRVRRGAVPSRWAAVRAGVARFGRNCFVYSEHGSWINIQTWLVDKDVRLDQPTLEPVCPKGCRKCIEACPTKALIEPFVMRMDRCIAYLTYDAPEPISSDLWESMGTWIYGCDVCQEVCPLNKKAWEPIEKAVWMEELASYLTPAALAAMDEDTYRTIVHPRFWYIPIDNLARWHANAKRALQHVSLARDHKTSHFSSNSLQELQ